MPGENISRDPCPTCASQGIISFLRNRPGFFATYCEQQHIFNDTDQLRILQAQAKAQFPQVFAKAETDTRPAQQEPSPVADTIEQVIVIDPETRSDLEKILGARIGGPSELKGLVRSQQMDLLDAKTQLEAKSKVPMTTSSNGTTFTFTVPEWCEEFLRDELSSRGVTMADYFSEMYSAFIEQNFSAPAGE
ncbi:MAG: hypothetical protein ACE5GH_06690 [Fidelibacterota bacterium]